jgi:hypothetical protein
LNAPVRAFTVGERVTLRKTHPCGSIRWVVDRVGADIGLTCDGCGRHVLLERRLLERRLAPVTPP